MMSALRGRERGCPNRYNSTDRLLEWDSDKGGRGLKILKILWMSLFKYGPLSSRDQKWGLDSNFVVLSCFLDYNRSTFVSCGAFRCSTNAVRTDIVVQCWAGVKHETLFSGGVKRVEVAPVKVGAGILAGWCAACILNVYEDPLAQTWGPTEQGASNLT